MHQKEQLTLEVLLELLEIFFESFFLIKVMLSG